MLAHRTPEFRWSAAPAAVPAMLPVGAKAAAAAVAVAVGHAAPAAVPAMLLVGAIDAPSAVAVAVGQDLNAVRVDLNMEAMQERAALEKTVFPAFARKIAAASSDNPPHRASSSLSSPAKLSYPYVST